MGKNKQLTLTEVLITIVAILITIVSLPYQAYIHKANHVGAQLTVTSITQQFERTNARQRSYPMGTTRSTVIDRPDTYIFLLAVA